MMAMLDHWVGSGNAATLIIAIVSVEAIILALWLRGRARAIIIGLVPGLCLMLALRAALLDQGAGMIALWLTASLPPHLIDLWGRIKASP